MVDKANASECLGINWRLIVIVFGIVMCTFCVGMYLYAAPNEVIYETCVEHSFYHLKERLNQIRQDISSSARISHSFDALVKLRGLLAEMGVETGSKIIKVNDSSTILNVCPEKEKKEMEGYPFYHQPYTTAPCTNVRPFSKVITVVFNLANVRELSASPLRIILDGIRKEHSDIPIIVATAAKITDAVEKIFRNYSVKSVTYKNPSPPGKILNSIIADLNTEYVLVAKDLFHFTYFTSLKRMVSILSNIERVRVVGGAFRNKTAFWKAGCYQVRAKNYQIRFRDGYFHSRNECMICDHVTTSFTTAVSEVKRNLFDERLPLSTVFVDWFLRLRLDGAIIMDCPDVMFFESETDAVEIPSDRTTWLPLAAKWNFDRIKLHDGTTFGYRCSEVNLRCAADVTDNYIIPPCCVQKLADALKEWKEFSEKKQLRYELQEDLVLGAVKLAGILPWKGKLNSINVVTNSENFDGKRKKVEGADDFYLAKNIVSNTSDATYLPKSLIGRPTKVQMNGIWLNGPANPGLYAKLLYGREYLKHSKYSGKSSRNTRRKSFGDCRNPNYHSCLNHFPIDGSVAFKMR